jgi:hypothetical protein
MFLTAFLTLTRSLSHTTMKKKRTDWSGADWDLLDSDLARIFKATLGAVRAARWRRNISNVRQPFIYENVNWAFSDKQIAFQLGKTTRQVHAARLRARK